MRYADELRDAHAQDCRAEQDRGRARQAPRHLQLPSLRTHRLGRHARHARVDDCEQIQRGDGPAAFCAHRRVHRHVARRLTLRSGGEPVAEALMRLVHRDASPDEKARVATLCTRLASSPIG
jgi:hypothetical protein